MSYIEVDTVQGILVLDPDRITGIGQASKTENQVTVVLFVSGDHVDVILHSENQATKLVDEVKKIIIQRKVRQPSKPIVIGKE